MQQESITTLVPHRDSEFHAVQNGNLNAKNVLEFLKTRQDILHWWKHDTGIAEEVKKQAQQRINSRNIMFDPGIQNLALKISQKWSTLGKLCRITKTSEEHATTWIPQKKHNCRTIEKRYLEDEKYHMRMHEQRYTQSDIEELDRIASANKGFTTRVLQNGLTTETNTRSYKPIKEEAATP